MSVDLCYLFFTYLLLAICTIINFPLRGVICLTKQSIILIVIFIYCFNNASNECVFVIYNVLMQQVHRDAHCYVHSKSILKNINFKQISLIEAFKALQCYYIMDVKWQCIIKSIVQHVRQVMSLLLVLFIKKYRCLLAVRLQRKIKHVKQNQKSNICSELVLKLYL